MKFPVFAALLASAALLVGCVSEGQPKAQNSPMQSSPGINESVSPKDVTVGMTKEEVRAALEKNPGVVNLHTDCWIYTNRLILGMDEMAETEVILIFENDVVVDRSVRIKHKQKF